MDVEFFGATSSAAAVSPAGPAPAATPGESPIGLQAVDLGEQADDAGAELQRPPGRARGWERNGPPPGLLKKADAGRVGFELGYVSRGRGRAATPEAVRQASDVYAADAASTAPAASHEEPVAA